GGGRAELRRADRAAQWSGKRENRQLPAWWEWANIRLLTRKKDWTAAQRKMMRRATRYHLLRGLVVAVFFAVLAWGAHEARGTLRAQALRERLLDANTKEGPAIIEDTAGY